MNIVLDEAIEEKPDGEKVRIGMVVCLDETNQTNRFFFRSKEIKLTVLYRLSEETPSSCLRFAHSIQSRFFHHLLIFSPLLLGP
jgi:hypothetical protein